MALKCASCDGAVFIMGRTTVFIASGQGPRTVYYAAHDYGHGRPMATRPDHPATLTDADVRAWAAESEAKERAEEKRVRKPSKKEYHAERAASYATVARDGLASPAWLQGEV